MNPLGRLEPTDFTHIEKYPLRAIVPQTVENVERTLKLPYQYRPKYDQKVESACVGFSSSWMMSILNRQFYDAFWLYHAAQEVDEWPGTAYEGTSVRAGMDVLRDQGHKILHHHKHTHDVELSAGITENRWATNVDEIRTCVANGVPVVLGANWYDSFDRPQYKSGSYWVPDSSRVSLGNIRGGHAFCLYAVSDKKEAFKITNSWGVAYPLTWFPYETVARLLNEYGEATTITDRIQ